MSHSQILKLWPFWYGYAVQDIANKYSRSLLGPIWITMSVAVVVAGMGPLYGYLFNYGGVDYTLYLATGIVYWFFISAVIGEACTAFLASEPFIKQTSMPLPVYVLRVFCRNILVFFHNVWVIILIYLYRGEFELSVLLAIPMFIVGLVLLFPICFVVAYLSTRFRDVIPLVQNTLMLAMFLTPVFWKIDQGLRGSYLVLNPFYHCLKLFRAPFFGDPISTNSLLYVCVLTLVTAITGFALHVWSKTKVVYWL